MPELPSVCPSVVLAAYAESIVESGRVLVVGAATSPLVERLLERGARLVHVVDPDPSRVAEAATRNAERNVSFAPLGPGGLPIRDGAFEVAIVENLATLSDPGHVLRQVRRALGARGTALVATPNPEIRARLLPVADAGQSLDYYAFFDLVGGAFERVKMLGQAPFIGYAVVEFAPEAELEPFLDAEFVPGGAEEPEWFLAVAAREGLALEPYTVVALPAPQVLGAGAAVQLEHQVRASRAAERQARDRLAEAETQLAERRPDASSQQHAEEIARLQAELARRDQWAQKLEDRASTADARADAVQADLDAAEERLARVTRELAVAAAERTAEQDRTRKQAEVQSASRAGTTRLETALAEARSRATAAETALAEARSRATAVEKSLAEARSRAPVAETALAEARARAAAAETALAEARARTTAAEKSLAEARSRVAAVQADREAAVAEARSRATVAEKSLAEARSRAAAVQADREATVAERGRDAGRLAELAAIEQQAAGDVAALEAQLGERGRRIQELEQASREATRAGTELIVELDRLRTGQQEAALRAAVAELGRRNAELTAELTARDWALAALRAQIDLPPSPADPPSGGGSDVTTGGPAAAEIALRGALAAAEARLSEQAVLVQQLRDLRSGAAAGDPATEPRVER